MSKLEGKPAPAFELPGSDGKPHALSSFRGKHVVLYFYPKDETPGCTKEACGFRDLHRELQKLGAIVLGISRDGVTSHRQFAVAHGLPFILLSDPDAGVMQKYGAWGEKSMYGKKVQGTIRSTVLIGPDGDVLKHWRTVKKAETHPGEVLDALREFLAAASKSSAPRKLHG